MTEEKTTTRKEEQKWLMSIQKKFKKFISNPKWDSLSLTNTEWDIVMRIMNTNEVEDLPILINERIVDHILTKISNQFKNMITRSC